MGDTPRSGASLRAEHPKEENIPPRKQTLDRTLSLFAHFFGREKMSPALSTLAGQDVRVIT